MTVISIYKIENPLSLEEVTSKLDKKKVGSGWMSAEQSRYTDSEAFVQYWYNEDIENVMKRTLPDKEAEEIFTMLKQNGRTVLLRRVYCFINLVSNTLEIYRWKDGRTDEIVSAFEGLLETSITPITIKPEDLKKLYLTHSMEVRQAIFKNVEGLMYEIMRGSCLENNEKFKDYSERFQDSLRIVSFRPRIRFLNGGGKYQITVNGDKGTVRFSNPDNGFNWRPRFEVRQVTFMIASTLGDTAG